MAKLEGLSDEWEDMDYRGIVSYMSGERTIVREADDWHLHNPNAEREASVDVERLKAVATTQIKDLVYETDNPEMASSVPDLDL